MKKKWKREAVITSFEIQKVFNIKRKTRKRKREKKEL